MARIDHINALRKHEELQKLFRFFFPALPAADISRRDAANIEKNLHKTIQRILMYLPGDLLEARPFKEASSTTIVHNQDRLAAFLKIAYEYSLVAPFENRKNGAPELSGTLEVKANIVRAWLRINKNSISVLVCHKCSMFCLPSELCELPSLHEIALSENLITKLPSEIEHLSTLHTLLISFNPLTQLPDEIGNLSTLTELYILRNKLTELPNTFGRLSALTDLLLSDNKLSKLPDGFGNLKALTELNLSFNKITRLPDDIEKLSALTKLNLAYNKLKQLPEGIRHHESVEEN